MDSSLIFLIQSDYLGVEIDIDKISSSIQKLRSQVNLTQNVHPILEHSEDIISQNEVYLKEIEQVNLDLIKIVDEYQMKIFYELSSVVGQQNDEVSLLNQIGGQFFQGIPKYETEQNKNLIMISYRDRDTTNPKQRFYCSVSLNNKEIGRGIGQNKKQSMQVAAKYALKNIAPKIYDEFQERHQNPESQIKQMQVTSDGAPKSEVNIVEKLNKLQISSNETKFTDVVSKEELIEQDKGSLETDLSLNCDDQVKIDDTELMTLKKHLTNKFTPISIIKCLQDKHKNIAINEDLEQYKNPLTNQNIFVVTFSLRDKNIVGRAEDANKKNVRQFAAQKFLKNLFPKGYTWNQLIDLVSQNKEPLSKIIDI